jgi:glycosyltransferase involved in cell wall biosynthesis
MKVLMVSKACVRGSYQKKLEELARFDDVDLTVIVPPYWQERGTRTPLERSHTDGYELLVEKVALNGHFHLHFYPHLAAQVTRLRPDIMHIDEEPYNLATFLAMRPAVRAGARPLFFTWQNLLRRYPFPFNLIERYNYRHAVHAIAGNREGVSVLRAKGYQGPAAVIPQFGVDPQIYKPRASRGPASSAPFRIGYVGRLVQEKGVDILIRAVAGLEGDWRLSILGEGQFAPRLEEITRELNLGDRVAFRAPLTSTEMPSHYRELDVLVLPSRTARHWKEQFGRVLIEAMACGVPVVGSDSGEIPHVMGQAGLTFPEGDIAALRLHLRRLMAVEDLRRSMAAEGRKRALNEYAQERVAAATRQVYVDMMEARP